MKLPIIATLITILVGCQSASTNATPAVAADLHVDFAPQQDRPNNPCGWVYAFDRKEGEADMCVFIWPDSTWTLAAETPGRPGAYTTIISNGMIVEGEIIGFPTLLLEGSKTVYSSGNVWGTMNGRKIPHGRHEDV